MSAWAAFLLASALILGAIRQRSVGWGLAALPFLFYGMAVRHNGPAAAVPLLFLLVTVVTSRRAWIAWVGTALLLISMLAVRAVDGALAPISSHPVQQIILHDLVAVSLATQINFLESDTSVVSGHLSLGDFKRLYTPERIDPLFVGSGPRFLATSSSAPIPRTDLVPGGLEPHASLPDPSHAGPPRGAGLGQDMFACRIKQQPNPMTGDHAATEHPRPPDQGVEGGQGQLALSRPCSTS